MKVLSIKPPWAYFIVYGVHYGVAVDNPNGSQSVVDSGKVILKNIENRTWPLPPGMKGQRIMVHVGKKEDPIEAVLDLTVKRIGLPFGPIMLSYSTKLPRGAIIGEVDIVGCVTDTDNPWFVGPYGFVLANPKAYEVPIPYRGRLGFFDCEAKE